MIINICLLDPTKGLDITYAFHEAVKSLYYSIEDKNINITISKNTQKNATNIIFGANQYDELFHGPIHENSIIYNLEQIDKKQDETVINKKYYDLLGKYEVWDYSLRNIEILKKKYNIKKIRYMPVIYNERMKEINNIKEEDKDIDILFYGLIKKGDRRDNILNKFRELNYKVYHASFLFGMQRNEIIKRTKLVLNISYYEDAILEIIRLSHLMINKACVLSEISNIEKIESEFEDALKPVSYDQIVIEGIKLLKDDAKRIERANSLHDYYKKISEKNKELEYWLRENLSKFETRSNDNKQIIHINYGTRSNIKLNYEYLYIGNKFQENSNLDIRKDLRWGCEYIMGFMGIKYVVFEMVDIIKIEKGFLNIQNVDKCFKNLILLLKKGAVLLIEKDTFTQNLRIEDFELIIDNKKLKLIGVENNIKNNNYRKFVKDIK